MATKQEIQDKIVARLNERIGDQRDCAVCGKNEWGISNRYARVIATRNANQSSANPGDGYPLQPIVCNVCGNTHFLNLLALGFTTEELKTMVYPAEESPDAATDQK